MQIKSNGNISSIDHLVVAAASLEEGVPYIEQLFGVEMQRGGKHVKMGTHNYLLKLGAKIYLEVIAVDPNAAKPVYPRWFDLDNVGALNTPRLVTWIAGTNNIHEAAKASPIDHGTIAQMSRGDLAWLLTIPEDGSMPCDGIAPMLIEWKNGKHPCDALEDKGCKLLKLEAFHPRSSMINAMLDSIGFAGAVVVKKVASKKFVQLVAHIQTANGICLLR